MGLEISILKRMMNKHQTLDKDKLDFFNRIKSEEHDFTSVSQAIEYVRCVIEDKPGTLINPLSVSFDKLPILKINIIDEALCSIIKEIFISRSINDFDNISYNCKIIEDLYSYIRNTIDNLENTIINKSKRDFLQGLINNLQGIIILTFPGEEIREDMVTYSLSKNYYAIMRLMYSNNMDEYFIKMEKFYFNKLKSYNHHG